MHNTREAKFTRLRRAIHLQQPDRMPFAGDYGTIEYRKDVYHLGEPELVEAGHVTSSADGKRRYTEDGGVWAVGDDAFKGPDDVLDVDFARFEVEEVGPAMLTEMARLYDEKARSCYPVPWHYGTLVTRAVLEFGWEPFLMASALDPTRMGEILDRFGAASLAVVQGWAQTEGTELIVVHDDIAGTRGVFLSPDWYRQHAFPWYARLFGAIHAAGRKVLYLSDGNYEPVLDDILALNPDGLYIESTSMEPAAFMQRAGRDLLYMIKSDSRHIDLGTPADIEAELKKLKELHETHPGMILYRGGGNPRPGNAEAFTRCFDELWRGSLSDFAP